jgi:hypothetical protein
MSRRWFLGATVAAGATLGCGADFDATFGAPQSTSGAGGAGASGSSVAASGGGNTAGQGGGNIAGQGGGPGGAGPTTTGDPSGAGGRATGSGGGAMGGGGASPDVGCSDGEREGYTDTTSFPDIAACAGGFTVPGSVTGASMSPACNRQAGDDAVDPQGQGCSIEDLCAEGWTVCASAGEVAARASACPTEQPDPDGAFWLTRQTAQFSGTCVLAGTNNLAGCGYGMSGAQGLGATCWPLDTLLWWDACDDEPPWWCGTQANSTTEAEVVVKPGAARGGVLCCRIP